MNWLTKLLSGVTELNMLKITGVFVATRTSRIRGTTSPYHRKYDRLTHLAQPDIIDKNIYDRLFRTNSRKMAD